MMKSNFPENSPLGRQQSYLSDYSPQLLYPIPRAQGYAKLGIQGALPFCGVDSWSAYELSWLNQRGKPVVAMACIDVPCESPNIIESKSFKLYLNSLNQTRFSDQEQVVQLLTADLSNSAGLPVTVKMLDAQAWPAMESCTASYRCIDGHDIDIDRYNPDAQLLQSNARNVVVEQLVSHLLRSNCPVTGQPDWGSLYLDYRGPQIDQAGLLRYLVSFREHQGFHEQCVEQIFLDLMHQCQPEKLTVTARYLRRGGLDINPVRSTDIDYPVIGRTVRQ